VRQVGQLPRIMSQPVHFPTNNTSRSQSRDCCKTWYPC